MRVIGSTLAGAFSGADNAIFRGLDERRLLVDIASADLPTSYRARMLLQTVSWNRRRWFREWRQNLTKSPEAFRRRTRVLDKTLRGQIDSYDCVLHVSGLFAPFEGRFPKPVGLFCDYTTKLAEMKYKPWFGIPPGKSGEWYQLERALYEQASVLFPASENTASSLVDHYGIDPARIRVVGEGVDGVHEHPEKTYDERTLLFVGYDFRRKGGEQLLDAFAHVRTKLPSARLRVVGPERPQRLQDGVTWEGRVADRTVLDGVFASATVFAMPSICEPFGLAIVEAMSHGLPVIGSNCDAMPEIIQEGTTGYIVPSGDHAALAERIIELLSSPDKARRMGIQARERVRNHFLWRHVVGRVLGGLYQITRESVA